MNFNRESYRTFYKNLTGFFPYEYQTKVAQHLIEGKNVILAVPTGAGKTWASIVPYLYARQYSNFHFPRKSIYSLPLRTLANSIHKDVVETLDDHPEFENLASIQTGEYKEDKHFEKDLIFSTIDQTLSNFCSFPLAISRSQANVNGGALIGSYLIFDEFHLLDPSLSMATTLGMIKSFRNLSRYCIMTATLSKDFIDFIIKEFPSLNFEKVVLDDFPDDIKKINSLKPAKDKTEKKQVHVEPEFLNAENIVTKHTNRTIVICNRVETAQKIFKEVEALKKSSTKLICIHSRFFDKDRKAKEAELKNKLGKHRKDKVVDVILIATQVIEAGMDISCEVMHTEISPANSFLQRIGRCARFENEFGNIYVYDVADPIVIINEDITKEVSQKKQIQKLNKKHLPYSSELCINTLNKLNEPEYKFINEQTAKLLVEEVMSDEEKNTESIIRTNLFNERDIRTSWENCDKGAYPKLIRDIQSIELVLIDKSMENEVLRNPFKYDSISMYRWSFVKWVNDIYNNEDRDAEEWIIKAVGENQFFFGGDADETKYQFDPLDNEDLKKHYDLTYLNADSPYFFYDDKIGLNLLTGNQTSPPRIFKEKETYDSIYLKDTFIQHNKALLGCFRMEFLDTRILDYALEEFNSYLGLGNSMKKEDWIKLIELMIVFHDYGKLNNKWQRWMQSLQKELEAAYSDIGIYKYEKGIPLGHSGLHDIEDKIKVDLEKNERIDKLIYKKFSKRPGHSGIGAFAIQPILEEMFKDTTITISTAMAISRHHGATSSFSCPEFKISGNNFNFFKKLIDSSGIETEAIETNGEEEDSIIDDDIIPDNWILYHFLVRILRICDQKATGDMRKYVEEFKKGINN
jgi:CRISPR-associated endonuclease/helicase Cas3